MFIKSYKIFSVSNDIKIPNSEIPERVLIKRTKTKTYYLISDGQYFCLDLLLEIPQIIEKYTMDYNTSELLVDNSDQIEDHLSNI